MKILIGILIPVVGTTLGSSMVFFMKNKINNKIEKFLLGFASGVMIAASVWSLLLPSIEIADDQKVISWLPASLGFMAGICFLIFLDYMIRKIKQKEKGKSMLALAVTLHNIPEGMAVGVAFAGVIIGNGIVSLESAIALAIGIGIQNFPEGAIISMPLKNKGLTKLKAFWYGTMSGIVEPIASVITILLTDIIVPILPYFLSFAAGAMIYVVVKELIPETQENENSNIGIIGLGIGFILMMILDVALG